MATLSRAQAVDRIFEAILDEFAQIDVFSNQSSPTNFIVYAHDPQPTSPHGGAQVKAHSEIVKLFIKWLRRALSRTFSDVHPAAFLTHKPRARDNAPVRDILDNQLRLLPTWENHNCNAHRVERVDQVVVFGSPRLELYQQDSFAAKYISDIASKYAEHPDANDESLRTSLLEKVIEAASRHPSFHHVLTELAFLQIRQSRRGETLGLVLVSLEKDMMRYLQCLETTNLRLMIDPEPSRGHLHKRFFKLLRLLYTSIHPTLEAFEEAYDVAVARVENALDAMGGLEVDAIMAVVRAQAYHRLILHDRAAYRARHGQHLGTASDFSPGRNSRCRHDNDVKDLLPAAVMATTDQAYNKARPLRKKLSAACVYGNGGGKSLSAQRPTVLAHQFQAATIAFTQLGLTDDEVRLLKFHQAQANSSSSRDASRASSQGLLLLDDSSLRVLLRHLDRLMQQIQQRIECLSKQSSIITQQQYDRAGKLVDNADAEIAQFQNILAEMDELEVDFDRIARIKDIVKGLLKRLQALSAEIAQC